MKGNGKRGELGERDRGERKAKEDRARTSKATRQQKHQGNTKKRDFTEARERQTKR